MMKNWDLGSGRESNEWQFPGVSARGFSPDGHLMFTAAHGWGVSVHVIASPGYLARILADPKRDANSASILPGNRILISGGEDHIVYCWDVTKLPPRPAVNPPLDADVTQTKPLYAFAGHQDAVTHVAASPLGQCIASASRDHTVRIWDLARPLRYHDFETRLSQARAALASAPNDPAAILTFADWYAFRGVDDWAVEFYEKARSTGAAFSHLDLARCYWKLNRLPTAREEFRQALAHHEASEDYLKLCLQAVADAPTSAPFAPLSVSARMGRN
jgi:WD40 repeat protein